MSPGIINIQLKTFIILKVFSHYNVEKSNIILSLKIYTVIHVLGKIGGKLTFKHVSSKYKICTPDEAREAFN